MTEDKENYSNDASAKVRLGELSLVLRDLHRALIEVEGINFGPVSGPFEMFNLASTHPQFAWLKPLITLIAALDERRTAADPPGLDTVSDHLARVEALLGSNTEQESEFRERLAALIQQSPEVAMAHGALRLSANRPAKNSGEPQTG